MPKNVKETRIELDADTDFLVRQWAAERGRSKRRHMAILVRRLTRKWDDKRRGINAR